MVFTAWEPQPRLSPRSSSMARFRYYTRWSEIKLLIIFSLLRLMKVLTSLETDIGLSVQFQYILPLNWKEEPLLYLRARFLVGALFSRLGRQKKRFCPQSAFWTTVQGGKWALIILSTYSSKLVIYRQERRLAQRSLTSWARIHFLLMSPISCLKYSIFQVVSWNSPILYFWL